MIPWQTHLACRALGLALVGANGLAAQRAPERFAEWSRRPFAAAEYAARRAALLAATARAGGGIVLIPSGAGVSGGDSFRQSTGFLYATGLEVVRSVLWLDADRAQVILFVPDRDPRWENASRPNDFPGRTLGGDPAFRAFSGIDSVAPIESLAPALGRAARARRTVQLDLGGDAPPRVGVVPREGWTPEREMALALASEHPTLTVRDHHEIVAALRMIKSPAEVAAIAKAVDAAANAMRAVVPHARPGATEWSLIGAYEAECRRAGAQRMPFTPIIKSGPNALWPWRVLASHYDRRARTLARGDFVIFDVGCERDYYVSDIGRTFPVGDRFSPAQRRAVELVTAVSDRVIGAIRPGVTLLELQRVALEAIPPEARAYMQTGSFFGHHIGLESGDPSRPDAPLAAGMVFTVEPWYYNHDTGIAAFIEDNVVVTEEGVRVLSATLPRSVAGLEAMKRGVRR